MQVDHVANMVHESFPIHDQPSPLLNTNILLALWSCFFSGLLLYTNTCFCEWY